MSSSEPARSDPRGAKAIAPSRVSDVVVVGAGAIGLTAAIALSRKGFSVVLIGSADARANGRTLALFDGSVSFLRSVGVWPHLAPLAAPLATIRIIDDTGSLFRPPPVAFHAREIGLEAFGFNIENDALVSALAETARQIPGLALIECQATAFDFAGPSATVTVDDGSVVSAQLIVAADGRRSPARAAAGISVRERVNEQTALTTILAHDQTHRDVSTEFHTREGPFTLVPLAASREAPHRSSLVWMMAAPQAERRRALNDQALSREIERQAHSMLGAMRVEGPVGLFPIASAAAARLSAPRLVLIGDAAHVFPPIGAQGLNLGLRDVAHLLDCLVAARSRARDLGGPELRSAYESSRRADILLRSASIEALNRSLLSDLLPMDVLRGAGLLALSVVGPLRRAVMREGVASARFAP